MPMQYNLSAKNSAEVLHDDSVLFVEELHSEEGHSKAIPKVMLILYMECFFIWHYKDRGIVP